MRFLIAVVILLATPAFGQVRVDARLEKTQFLEDEPIFVVVDVTNVGDEPLTNSTCGGEFKLDIPGTSRRIPPNIFGCSGGGAGVGVCGTEGRLFMPGERISSRYLLTEYSLKAGRYNLIFSGRAGYRWNFNSKTQTGGSLPVSRHAETEPVLGDEVKLMLSFDILKGSEDDLKRVMSKYVSEANRPAKNDDQLKRIEARKAIIESAPPFLETLIAQFASEDTYPSAQAVEALGRIGNTESRSDLKKLYAQTKNENIRPFIVLTLARVGHADDSTFFADVLENLPQNEPWESKVAREIKMYAALGLGRIGGDSAVRLLKTTLANVDPEVLPFIATALGNTGSRSAVPVLISMFGNNPARNDVCIALSTLTHKAWCDGSGDDVRLQKDWQIWWDKNHSTVKIYETDQCPDYSELLPIR